MKYIISEFQLRLISEQTIKPKVYTDETEYKKALSKYNKDLLVYNWLEELETLSKQFNKKDTSLYRFAEMLLSKPYGKQIGKIYSGTITELLLGLSYAFTAFGRNKNQINVEYAKQAKEVYKFLGLDIGKRIGKFPMLIFWGQVVFLPIYPKPIKPIYKPSTPPKLDVKPEKLEPTVEPKKLEPTVEPKKLEPEKTNFVVTWRDENGRQASKYYNSYDDWKKFVDSNPQKLSSKQENSSKNQASALYLGNPTNLIPDKTN